MQIKKFKNDNWSAWYYDVGFRREFRITYKLPMWSEIKEWFKKKFKKKKSKP